MIHILAAFLHPQQQVHSWLARKTGFSSCVSLQKLASYHLSSTNCLDTESRRLYGETDLSLSSSCGGPLHSAIKTGLNTVKCGYLISGLEKSWPLSHHKSKICDETFFRKASLAEFTFSSYLFVKQWLSFTFLYHSVTAKRLLLTLQFTISVLSPKP